MGLYIILEHALFVYLKLWIFLIYFVSKKMYFANMYTSLYDSCIYRYRIILK